MATIAEFNNLLTVALEAVRGTPSAGPFLTAYTQPTQIQPIMPKITPTGEHVGTPDVHPQPSVPGRRHSAGTFDTILRTDTFGLFMKSALGTDTVAVAPAGALVRKAHTLRCADIPPSMTLQDFKGARVASAERAYQYPAMDIQSFTIRWDWSDDTGVITVAYQVLGYWYTLIAKPTAAFSEDDLLIPSWSPTIKKDGAGDSRLLNFTLTFNRAVERVRASAGTQDDQDHNFNERQVTFSFDRYMDTTESEVYAGLAMEPTTVDLLVEAPGQTFIENVGGADYYDGFDLHLPKAEIIGFPPRTGQNGMMVESVSGRARRDDTIGGPIEIVVYNDIAAYVAA